MSRRIRVMIVENRRDTRELMKRYLQTETVIEIAGEADTGPAAVDKALDLKPDIVVMYEDMRGMSGYEACEKITAARPEISVILMGREGDAEHVRKAMISGAKDFIALPLEPNALVSTIRIAYKKRLVVRPDREDGSGSAIGKVVSVFSTKGGVGKTTIALNLAVALARMSDRRVALVDMDLQFGDIALMADVEPERTIADLLEESGSVDTEVLKNLMSVYLPNLMILASPPGPEYAEYISGETVGEIVESLRKSYDYIIVDTASNFSDVTLAVLDRSDKILTVAGMDIVSAKNVKIGLEIMKSLEYPEDRIELLVNMGNGRLGIGYADLERVFGRKIAHKLPDDKKNLVKAVNRGYPHVERKKRGKTSKAFGKLAKSFLDK